MSPTRKRCRCVDLDDLQAMLVNVGERADELTLEYGNVAKTSVGAIQRSLLQLRSQGGDNFFGEPALDLDDFLHVDDSARGVVNILAADKLMASPRLYSTFLLWLLSELFEQLPEVGDQPLAQAVLLLRRGASAVRRRAASAAARRSSRSCG